MLKRAAIVVACAWFMGCGGSSGGGSAGGSGSAGGGSGGGGGTAGGGGSSANDVPLMGNVTDSEANVLAGATVTVAGTSVSTTTSATGSYTLMVAAGSSVFVEAAKATFQSEQIAFVVPAGGGTMPTIKLLPTTMVAGVVAGLTPPLTLDSTKGTLLINLSSSYDPGGYTVSIGAASHGNPFNPGLNSYTNTIGSGELGGTIVFPNVAVGMTTVTVTGPTGHTCTADQSVTNQRVDAGIFTSVDYTCT